MAPTKWMRGWAWEHYWLIFAITAYLVAPWLIAIATIPRLFEIYAEASRSSLLSVIIYGSGWGIGAVTFGLGVDALGLALGFALILGVATIAGTVIPLLVTPHSGLSGEQIALVTVSLVIMLIGVTVCLVCRKVARERFGTPELLQRRVHLPRLRAPLGVRKSWICVCRIHHQNRSGSWSPRSRRS